MSYRTYCSQLCEYRDQCGAMLGEASAALDTLGAMRDRHQHVTQKTGALHHACEQLMEDQVLHWLHAVYMFICVYICLYLYVYMYM